MRPRPSPLRRDLALASVNAALWAVGNGLVSTTLVIYLALELGAEGLAVSAILAAPRFTGALRLGLPAVLARVRRRKAMCLLFFAASGSVLLGMSPLAMNSAGNGIAILVVAWCLHHLLQYCGTVLLWSWLGDLTPLRVRGRLFGVRERWLAAGRMAGLGAGFGLASAWAIVAPSEARWTPLSYSASIGAVLLALSAAPLAGMRSLEWRPSAAPRKTWGAILFCFVDPAYRRLLLFSFCFAVANGLTATAQSLYPQRVLEVRYEEIVGLRAMMRTGQAGLAPAAGRWIDRFGPRGLMFISQLVVATGPLFYWMATADAPWWFAGAWVVWIAYVGLNVGLDHLKVSLAPADNNAPAIAAYHAIGDLANGLMILVGGVVFDRLSANGADALWLYGALFVAGWLARTAAAGLLLRLIEPSKRQPSAP